MTDDEENLHQDSSYNNYMMRSYDVVDPAWAKNFAIIERLGKYIIKQREEMASLLVTIQESIFDEEVVQASEECDSYFDTEFLSKQPITSEWSNNERKSKGTQAV